MVPIKNKQNFLAEEFHLKDIQINKLNYEANLKIKRWKFIMNIPGIGTRIREEATNDIHDTFLIYLKNSDVLGEEGFYDEFLEN